MNTAFIDAGDQAGAGQLAELAGLVRWRTRTGWNPLVQADLPQRTGRQLVALTDMIRTAATRVSTQKIRNGTADGGPGRYLRTPAKESLWVGIWFGWWDRYGPGPVWAQASLQQTAAMNLFAEALTAAGIAHQARPEYTDVLNSHRVAPGSRAEFDGAGHRGQLSAIITATDHLGVDVVEDDSAAAEGSSD